jgi:hypothetical protein
MTTSPQFTSSVQTLIETGRRVCRLCDREGAVARPYAEDIQTAIGTLSAVWEEAEPKTFERKAGYDALLLADTQLDEAVRVAFFACRTIDLESSGPELLEKAFPGGGFSLITRAPRSSKPELVTRLIARIADIASGNKALVKIAQKLTAALEQATEATRNYEEKLLEESTHKARANIAKQEYIERYMAIYHKACSDLGKKQANSIFPIKHGEKKKDAKPEGTAGYPISSAA